MHGAFSFGWWVRYAVAYFLPKLASPLATTRNAIAMSALALWGTG